MDTAAIRAAFLAAPEKTQDIVIPDWLQAVLQPGTKLAIKDLPHDELAALRAQNECDPQANNATYSAALICKCLINRATGDLIFQPTDRDAIAHLGTTKLNPLYEQMAEFFGLSPEAKETAKKN